MTNTGTFTVTITDQHPNTAKQANVVALNFLSALVIVLNAQLLQGEIENLLKPQDNLTVTVTSP